MTNNVGALTTREQDIFQSLLDVNDRGAFYTVVNAQFGAESEELLAIFGGSERL